jgi:hypothetical protein
VTPAEVASVVREDAQWVLQKRDGFKSKRREFFVGQSHVSPA